VNTDTLGEMAHRAMMTLTKRLPLLVKKPEVAYLAAPIVPLDSFFDSTS
jgi:hypothetical protein